MSCKVVVNKETLEIFWQFVDKTGGDFGCWLYTGRIDNRGYGLIQYRGDRIATHRLSYTIHKGQIPERRFILHTCDVKPCVQPLHLWPGTQADNVRDMNRKGRHGVLPYHRGEKGYSSKLTDEQVKIIRERYLTGGVTEKDIAREYGVTHQTISTWICGRRAGTTCIGRSHAVYALRGEAHHNSRLTEENVRSIRQEVAQKIQSMTALARQYGVTKSLISQIVHRKAWTHVE